MWKVANQSSHIKKQRTRNKAQTSKKLAKNLSEEAIEKECCILANYDVFEGRLRCVNMEEEKNDVCLVSYRIIK